MPKNSADTNQHKPNEAHDKASGVYSGAFFDTNILAWRIKRRA